MEERIYTINGIKVKFPCKAYPSQVSMMDKMIKGIDRGQNCLIESPTGSGKSLALLCASLAWQTHVYEKELKKSGDYADQVLDCVCSCHSAKKGKEKKINRTESDKLNKNGCNDDDCENMGGGCGENMGGGCGESMGGCCGENGEYEEKTLKKKFKIPLKKKKKIKSLVYKCSDDDEEEDVSYDDDPYKVNVDNDLSKDGGNDDDCFIDGEDDDEGLCNDCACQDLADSFEKPKIKVAKIFVGTRTHKQIAQIIREMGKTAYRDTRMTVLSSREHTCINPEVKGNKNEECKLLLENRACKMFEKVKRSFTYPQLTSHQVPEPWDIEDIVSYGRQTKSCPYFGCRELMNEVDIIFCPYNYLIDPLIRNSMKINLRGHVVVLDEGHNIEDSCRDAASFTLSSNQLQQVLTNLSILSGQYPDQCEFTKLEGLCTSLNTLIENNKSKLDQTNNPYKNNSFNNNKTSFNNNNNNNTWSGMEMLAQLEMAGLALNYISVLEKAFRKVLDIQDNNKLKPGEKVKKKKEKISSLTTQLLEGVFTVMRFIYGQDKKYIADYRVALTRTMEFNKKPSLNGWMSKANKVKGWTYHLNFWCLNAAVAFEDMSKDCQSIVLTSGTLSPLISFQSELNAPFPVQLEAAHVINHQQALITCLSTGPHKQLLLGTYNNAEKFIYQDEVAALLLSVCKMVPHGVLCFLPSYKSLEKFTTRWQTTGIMEKIGAVKHIFVEPRSNDKENFDDVIRDYYQTIQITSSNTSSKNGAIFLAVCRGKVSEGMDFADDYARAVVLVSIPYPNIMDTQISLKRRYNDDNVSRGLLSSRDWYEIQAFRALNQALGRCIRHRNDWGTIIMADSRFASNPNKYIPYLSKWVRQRIKFHTDYQHFSTDLQNFVKERTLEEEENNINNNNINDNNKKNIDDIDIAKLGDNRDISFDYDNRFVEGKIKVRRSHGSVKRIKNPKKIKMESIARDGETKDIYNTTAVTANQTTLKLSKKNISESKNISVIKIDDDDDCSSLEDFIIKTDLKKIQSSTPKTKDTEKNKGMFMGSLIKSKTVKYKSNVTEVIHDIEKSTSGVFCGDVGGKSPNMFESDDDMDGGREGGNDGGGNGEATNVSRRSDTSFGFGGINIDESHVDDDRCDNTADMISKHLDKLPKINKFPSNFAVTDVDLDDIEIFNMTN